MKPLAEALRQAVLQLDFPAVTDSWQGGRALGLMPSIDLAVVHFASDATPQWANVLFSREHPQGVVADIDALAGTPRNIRFDKDARNAALDSTAWLPGAD